MNTQLSQRHLGKFFVFALPLLFAASLHSVEITTLRCEYRADPLGIDVTRPRLSDVRSFACSDPLLNRIHQVNRSTLRCFNLGGYMVDCPHRQRMGCGDGQVSLEGRMMNCDACRLYELKYAQ